ncbi:phycobilisome linker polypeptide [Desertifilum sp. FACHB-1129]|uniref:Photosystem I reaction center subunit XII n=3 Tax=Cyanophyceae TaxID=3028117 RepID=A0A1E5QES1_9CYAN|nr:MULTISPECIES: phycobilisome linker polypeptide [Cyanophyceae]MCD8485268.1 phycobilisome linker polypeptide [Desertifilum sp.]MDA0212640.1 phycobilisome linker polypeptide [Cyanobacteria bacterium FC1]MDI9638773.1 phycobilisome linker polypeptide [Geitlerinema splendidum]MBD2313129.1 phycobilisome linker polypeptide [Desertifilum sp. FACHB-1129]MBD2324065.1 phycobilisome linker polypeptide [Desertifilum sp. FACHB-866]
MAITAAASRLGTSAFSDMAKVELRQNWTKADVEMVIRAAYRQLLGNDYLMASERLTSAESLLRDGNISVREFVRCVAKSELYKTKFFYNNFQTRFIELNYKHLLGRAPYDEAEVIYHLDLYHNEGYDAEIDSYIDSEEYTSNFGDNIVPYYRGFATQPGQKTVGFNRMFRLYRGYANSDRAQVEGTSSRLARELARNSASSIVGPSGSNPNWAFRASGDLAPRQTLGNAVGEGDRVYRIEVTGVLSPGYPKVRRSSTAIFVPYERLSSKMQELQKTGAKIVSISPA